MTLETAKLDKVLRDEYTKAILKGIVARKTRKANGFDVEFTKRK
jgi:hypothetical protein